MELNMKTLKFLTLAIFGISTTLALAENIDIEDKKFSHVRSAATSSDPSFLASIQAAKDKITTRNVMDTKNPHHIIIAKNVLKANYEALEKSQLKAQRKQRIAARKERIECAKKIKMINHLPAKDIDTLNVAKFMQVFFLFPKAKNPDLEEAVVLKMNHLGAEIKKGPRQYAEDQDRIISHLTNLDVMYSNVGKLHKKFEVKHGQRHVVQKPSPLHVKEIFKQEKSQTRAFARRIKVWNKITNKAAAAA